jgi:hypothetical protein
MSKFIWIAALGLVAGTAVAGNVRAPEIDVNSAMSGITLLLGGLTVLRGRFRK